MDLLIDIGNTRAKMALSDGVNIRQVAPLSGETLALWNQQHTLRRAIASVVGQEMDFPSLLPHDLWHHFHQLSAQSRLPITLHYDTPSTLGPDRIAAVAGAQKQAGKGPLLVIDAGTCVTIDFLDENNGYQGGAIFPGIAMKFRALNTFTAKLPLLEKNEDFVPLTGKSTEGSIRSGVMLGTLLEIKGFIQQYRALHPELRVFLTGGDAPFLAAHLQDTTLDNDLLWKGLQAILNENIQQQ